MNSDKLDSMAFVQLFIKKTVHPCLSVVNFDFQDTLIQKDCFSKTRNDIMLFFNQILLPEQSGGDQEEENTDRQ